MINLNTQLFKELPAGLARAQRGIYYADALFETIRIFKGRIPLMERHWERLLRGLTLMRYQIPSDWSAAFFQHEVLKTAPQNARVRLSVWRAPGGLYAPENNEPQFLITVQDLESGFYEWSARGLQTGLCESVRLPVDTFSGLKTLNAARYVAAAQEAQARGWDDSILLNAYDRVCEATSSNIFWFEEGTLCTLPLSDGCVTGVMRDLLLTLTSASGRPVVEKSITYDRLMKARELFFTNAVRGIRWVEKCEGKVFENAETRKLYDLTVRYFSGKLMK